MTPVLAAVIVIILMIMLNAFFSMSEMAVVSSRKSKLKVMAEEGHQSYGAALKLAENPSSFLSTIQTGITLIGILAGAYGEATISEHLRIWLAEYSFAAEYSEVISIGSVVICITFVSIIFGELIPKRIALYRPEKIAAGVSYPIKAVSMLLLPFSKILTGLTDLLMNIIPLKKTEDLMISEEEIKLLLREGEELGQIKKQHGEMVEAALDIHDTKLPMIMQPRPEIRYIEITESPKKIKDRIIEFGDYSYLPVCRNGLDNIVGFVKTREVLRKILRGEFKTINKHIEKPLYVPEGMGPIKLLEQFKQNRTHIAFVVDEYGGIMGLVTLSDITEEIVGKTPASRDDADDEIVKRKDGSFLVDGIISIEDFRERFPLEDSGGDYNTLAGFIMDYLCRIPKTGESFEYGGFLFEIIDMDGNRIDKVLIKKAKK
jgi:putative hemolysin